MKYDRFCEEHNEFRCVRSKDGGGIRFIDVNTEELVTFKKLKRLAISLYFDRVNDTNHFEEQIFDCLTHVASITGDIMDEDENLWSYIARKGICLSKTVFFLQSTYVDPSLPPSVFDATPQEQMPLLDFSSQPSNPLIYSSDPFSSNSTMPGTSQTPLQTTSMSTLIDPVLSTSSSLQYSSSSSIASRGTRMICHVCSCTYQGDFCLVCQQNFEFDSSLLADSLTRQDANDEDVNGNQYEDISIQRPSFEELRQIRINNLAPTNNNRETVNVEDSIDQPSTGNSIAPASPESNLLPPNHHVISIHRMRTREDLITEFMNKEVSIISTLLTYF